MMENIAGKRNYFLLFAQCFPKILFLRIVKLLFVKGLRGLLSSVVKCLTCNPGVLDPLRSFLGLSLGKSLKTPSLVLVKPRKDINNVSYRRDMTEILMKAA